MDLNPAERIAVRRLERRRRVRRRRMLAVGVPLATAALVVAMLAALGDGSDSRSGTASRGGPSSGAAGQTRAHSGDGIPAPGSAPVGFVARRLGVVLPVPLQDAAAVVLPDGTLALLGGLDGADASTAGVLVLAGEHISTRARLPLPQHDAQSALLGNDAYVFGGGQVSSYDHVLRFDPATNAVSQAGALPGPASDVAVAAVGRTAYVVGGYSGARALDTILAWRSGGPARTVAKLPLSLRYAAVAAVGGQLVIAGGSHGEAAEREVLRFDPATGHVVQIGRLPSPLTHAAAVTLQGQVYLLGGRGSASFSQTDAILAIDPATGRVVRVGRLPVALSDMAAAIVGRRVVVAGGEGVSGTQSSIYSLAPVAARSAAG